MRNLIIGSGILGLILVISCAKEKDPRPYNGHLVTNNVTLHADLATALAKEKGFDPSQNCIQLVEYSRTPNKSSRSDFYLLFSPNPCPSNETTVEQFAFAAEIQGMEQPVNSMRLYNRLNEMKEYTAQRSAVSTGWLDRVMEGDKASGFVISEICNYTRQMKVSAISSCELRIENGRFAIPRDTSLTAKEDQEARTQAEQKRNVVRAAEQSREDVVAHNNQLFDLQVELINRRFNELTTYLDEKFRVTNNNLDWTRRSIRTQIFALHVDMRAKFAAEMARLDDLEAKVIKDLSKKVEDEAKETNKLILVLQKDIQDRMDDLKKQGKDQHDVVVAQLKDQSEALDKLDKALAKVDTKITTSTAYITTIMTLENYLTNININLVRANQKDLAQKLEAQIEKLRIDTMGEIKASLDRATSYFDFYKMVEKELGKLNDAQVKTALERIAKSNTAYQKQIEELTKALKALELKPSAALTNYLDEKFRVTNSNIDWTRISIRTQVFALHVDLRAKFAAEMARLDKLEATVIEKLSKKLEDDLKETNKLILALQKDVQERLDALKKQGKDQQDEVAAKLKDQIDALGKLDKALAKVDTKITTSTAYITTVMTLEKWLTNVNLNLVSASQKDVARKTEAQIEKLRTDAMGEIKASIDRATTYFNFFKMVEKELGKLNDAEVRTALDKLGKSNAEYQQQIEDLTKALKALEAKVKNSPATEMPNGLDAFGPQTKNLPVPPELENERGRNPFNRFK